jgi:hypothetical protein
LNDQRNGGFLAYFDSVNKIAVALGAVVALIAGIVALVYQLWPNPGPPPPPRNATMTITDSFRARFIDFLLETDRTSLATATPSLSNSATSTPSWSR